MSNDSKLRNGVALQILRYLLAHPQAADSDAGVGLWWLRGDCPVPQSMVREALDALVQRTWLQVHDSGPETRIYRFNLSEADAVRRFTEQAGEDRNG